MLSLWDEIHSAPTLLIKLALMGFSRGFIFMGVRPKVKGRQKIARPFSAAPSASGRSPIKS